MSQESDLECLLTAIKLGANMQLPTDTVLDTADGPKVVVRSPLRGTTVDSSSNSLGVVTTRVYCMSIDADRLTVETGWLNTSCVATIRSVPDGCDVDELLGRSYPS